MGGEKTFKNAECREFTNIDGWHYLWVLIKEVYYQGMRKKIDEMKQDKEIFRILSKEVEL